ncbi:MAG: FAD-dependent oxidoreductase [Candidatus Dormibacteraeota bacterium]|nr:FAD-dependent oxidoreductase [Candidatus Dormibacteraeota bacterium]
MARVAVAGAGLAGLAAGLELRKLGFEVDLFERSRLVGGKAASFEAGGAGVDTGQHVFLGCFDQWLDLVREVGMLDELELQPRFEVTILAPGRSPVRLTAGHLPTPGHLLPALLGHRLLGWSGRLQVARALLAARAEGPEESLASWLERQGQGGAARAAFWEPFMVPALNAPLELAPAEDGRFVIRTAFLGPASASRIGWTRGPLGRVAEAAAERAGSLHLRTPVTGLEMEGERLVALLAGERRPVDGAVLALPPGPLARVLEDPQRHGVRGLDALVPQAIVDVHLWYEGAGLGLGFGALIGSPVQWVFEKEPGHLCCSLSAATELVGRPEEELAELCHRELEQVLPQLRGLRPLRALATRDPQATYVAPPGARRPGAATALANVVVAGAWTDTGWPATMESAVRSGRAAARLLAQQLAVHRDGVMVA